ncbi:hypothetical protein A3C24_05060 [Candidatus Roizmanbacteria bacterium RIFCSPHIGHO2_02_FULL_37_24]|uniref:Transposase IS200-like domain-containing protein n=2 Tax=Bacteria candidate phyla TaxID=1783234 RepID=A0A1F4VG91_UNCKA|nr:MAG: hypothetical protein A3H26_03810 [candidate division WWE3 bacterium RIFCSPLOWO2_12_FULL_36_10]OGK24787.1 MAG: hypothetical protein A3C24_05060 [Candidatus Roizmanbacteria bacterium RIFCSPHIGHO2_02_FULL_37_24]
MERRRQSIRLRNYDYSQSGWYLPAQSGFVTVCAQNRKCLFGGIVNGEMVLNDIGNVIKKWWNKIQERFNMAELDTCQIMPDHIHTIIQWFKQDRILSKPLTCKIIHSIIITIMKFRPKHARPKR